MARRILIVAALNDAAYQQAAQDDITEIALGIPPALRESIGVEDLPYIYEEPEVASGPEPADPFAAAMTIAVRLMVTEKLTAEALDDETVATIAALFDPWEPGLTVAAGDVLAWDGTLVECIQAHTTQADWTPSVTPALWRIHRTDQPGDDPPAWQAGIAVVVGEQFTYAGSLYQVLQAHTTQVGWEPDAVPALWQLVDA